MHFPTETRVDIVVPVYNEVAALAASIRRLHEHVRSNLPFACRIVIADNASTDGTAMLAQALAEDLEGVEFVHLNRKGRGRALREVWSHSGADVVCYKVDSEVTRLNRGELAEAGCHPAVREVLAACRALRERTGGAFDAEAAARMPAVRHRLAEAWRDDAVEPAGYVKGWAVAGAWERLSKAGVRNAMIEAGGDMILRGRPAPGRRWRVGIQHPDGGAALAAVLELADLAVATSGTYRRGDHIVDPSTGRPPGGVRSVTCVGRDIAIADAFATAAYAMGAKGAEWVARRPEVEGLVIGDDGLMRFTPGFDALRADSASSQVGLTVAQA